VVCALGMMSCGELQSDDADDSIEITDEAPGSNCGNGGVRIATGSTVQYICNGADGTNGVDGTNYNDRNDVPGL